MTFPSTGAAQGHTPGSADHQTPGRRSTDLLVEREPGLAQVSLVGIKIVESKSDEPAPGTLRVLHDIDRTSEVQPPDGLTGMRKNVCGST